MAEISPNFGHFGFETYKSLAKDNSTIQLKNDRTVTFTSHKQFTASSIKQKKKISFEYSEPGSPPKKLSLKIGKKTPLYAQIQKISKRTTHEQSVATKALILKYIVNLLKAHEVGKNKIVKVTSQFDKNKTQCKIFLDGKKNAKSQACDANTKIIQKQLSHLAHTDDKAEKIFCKALHPNEIYQAIEGIKGLKTKALKQGVSKRDIKTAINHDFQKLRKSYEPKLIKQLKKNISSTIHELISEHKNEAFSRKKALKGDVDRDPLEISAHPLNIHSQKGLKSTQAAKKTALVFKKQIAMALKNPDVEFKAAGGKGAASAIFIEEPSGMKEDGSKKMKKLAVMKCTSSSHFLANCKQAFINLFAQRGMLSRKDGKEPLVEGEAQAYNLSQKTEVFKGLIPETVLKKVHVNKKGDPVKERTKETTKVTASIQKFGEGYELATSAIKDRLNSSKKGVPTKEELKLFRKMASFDYILGNLDRHGENYMVKRDPKGEIIDIILIDNGPSFPEKFRSNRTHTNACHNQYNWATFTAANKPLDEETKQLIKGLDVTMFNDIGLSPKAKELAEERLTLLKAAAEDRIKIKRNDGKEHNFTLKDIMLISSENQHKNLIKTFQNRRNKTETISWDRGATKFFEQNKKRNTDKGRQ